MNDIAITTLPLRVDIIDGEAVDSWIEALARRNGTSPQVLLQALGAGYDLRRTRHLLNTTTDPTILRHLEHMAGLPADRLDAATGRDRSWATHNFASGRSRFCPQCLSASNGRWPLSWRSRWQLACPQHHALLLDTCPACADTPRSLFAGGRDPVPASTCTHIVAPPRGRCGTDLSAAHWRAAPKPVLDNQHWVQQLIAAPAAQTRDPALSGADLLPVISWLLASDLDGALADAQTINPDRSATTYHSDGTPTYLDTALTAALLARARTLLDNPDQPAITLIRTIWANNPRPQRFPPAGIDFRRWQPMNGRFPSRFVRAMDPDLGAMTRLRLKSPITSATHTAHDTTPRLHAIPQMLWPDWTSRLLPASRLNAERFRAALSILLLLPGSHPTGDYTTLLNPRISAGNLTKVLQGMAKLPTGSAVTDVITLLCRIADHLDTTGSPIDYQRRRELLPAKTITWQQWRDVACAAGAHPGDPTRGRLRFAQRHPHQLLAGADLADQRHPLTFRDATDRTSYITFLANLTPQLRCELHRYGQQLLVKLGINEPLTWSPPTALAAGLALPGIDPADLDTDQIRRLVFDEHRCLGDVAEALGLHIDHVRLAMEGLDRPHLQQKSASPAAWHRDRDAARVLTREYFEREYLRGGRNLGDIATETGFGARRVSRVAKQLGIPLRKAADAFPLNPQWLREQYCDRLRTSADIATELGTDQQTINYALHRFAIPTRPQGTYSRTEYLRTLDHTVPARVRTAVEGQLGGWLRLHRFQIAMAFPNLATAMAYLGTHTALLAQFQRLEQQIGGPLFQRADRRTPQHPTTLGQALLADLDTDNVQQLMLQALGTKAMPMPTPAAIEAVRADASSPTPARQPRHPDNHTPRRYSAADTAKQLAAQQRKRDYEQIFADLAIRPIRIAAESTLVILNDLLHAPGEQSYGLAVLHRTGLTEGTVYQALERLHKAGWLTSQLEDEATYRARCAARRPNPTRRRTYYRFTPDGRTAAQRALTNNQIRENARKVRTHQRQTVEKQPDSSRS
ncbi:TniQ family protein [Nocardia terpenica]|uniref:TniQ domain-containing protein n=1 Tax=Nocardia terpenica TaxID=455432 RepID=A0A164PGF0_9NOCA|nr:TniQ family protein [Nocardia terpenica]KZM75536.1 hypothetical protein AWN90_19360 [Nocardia terpenica]NQE86018.1 hypothetical protein [Nocardia terpenica]